MSELPGRNTNSQFKETANFVCSFCCVPCAPDKLNNRFQLAIYVYYRNATTYKFYYSAGFFFGTFANKLLNWIHRARSGRTITLHCKLYLQFR